MLTGMSRNDAVWRIITARGIITGADSEPRGASLGRLHLDQRKVQDLQRSKKFIKGAAVERRFDR